jgi:hypothetical protein
VRSLGILQIKFSTVSVSDWKITTEIPTRTRLHDNVAQGSICTNLEQSMGFRNRVGIGLSYRPARLHRLAELIPWKRFFGSLKVSKFGICLCLLTRVEKLSKSDSNVYFKVIHSTILLMTHFGGFRTQKHL